ncbi:hypothetical protein FKW50_06990 [Acetobacter pomorum]|uniref:hypothetical protein n=1 Tax=Acetobacter pomorum TaxID=65959 RepID=UPI00126F5EC6|nr:hypothetical protein [Acetobacter pomorum]KAA8419939.1 hypothetical protein FKW54_14290 [Acetobacter pomorum]KAA8435559.1 hypothetical protein FKW50_06990 [Acetobacter pomorum]KAA8448308.1 hypothetical protein FKW52_13465 [Acetobacter pomorum]
MSKGDSVLLLAHENQNWQFSDFFTAEIVTTDGEGTITIANLQKEGNLLGDVQKEVDYKSGFLTSIQSDLITIPVQYIWAVQEANKK